MKIPNPNRKMTIGVPPKGATIPQLEHEIKFEGHQMYEGQASKHLYASTDAVTLDEILPAFEDFLRGMGFSFKGHVDIVDEEEA